MTTEQLHGEGGGWNMEPKFESLLCQNVLFNTFIALLAISSHSIFHTCWRRIEITIKTTPTRLHFSNVILFSSFSLTLFLRTYVQGGLCSLLCRQGKQRERRAAWPAAVQESGYDENVLDATILSELPAIERRRRREDYYWHFFHTSTASGRSGTGTLWQLKVTGKVFGRSKLLFHPLSLFVSSQRLRERVGGRKDGHKSDLKQGSWHVWKVSYAI